MKRFWVILTEDELYAWVHCRAWTLPRKPIPLEASLAKDVSAIGDVFPSDFAMETLLVVEYASERGGRVGTAVPFYRVTVLYGLTDERTKILQDRYLNLGVDIANFDRQNGVTAVRVREAVMAEIRCGDLRRGASALLELFGLKGDRETSAVVEESCYAVNGQESTLSELFDYSRAAPWPYEGYLAAVCDLGKVLRRSHSSEVVAAVTNLATAVKATVNSESCDLARIRGLMDVFGAEGESRFVQVLFLHWKYAAERKGGRVDFAALSDTIRELGTHRLGDARKSLAMFGAFSGFRSFAEEYHIMMRNVQSLSAI